MQAAGLGGDCDLLSRRQVGDAYAHRLVDRCDRPVDLDHARSLNGSSRSAEQAAPPSRTAGAQTAAPVLSPVLHSMPHSLRPREGPRQEPFPVSGSGGLTIRSLPATRHAPSETMGRW